MTVHHLHLVSDATGETLNVLAKAAIVQFDNVDVVEHDWSLVRRPAHLEKAVEGIRTRPGLVMCTFVDRAMHDGLEAACRDLRVPCLSVMDPILAAMANHFGAEVRAQPGRQHAMDAEYFGRIEAMGYCLAHDDGQLLSELPTADVVLVGVSRTSKTPICMYLANRGLKVANVPLVPDLSVPKELMELKGPLVVGLTTSSERLIHIRRNRLLVLKQDAETAYVDPEHVKEEIAKARRLFEQHGWPVIDVTRRSIEETAAGILHLCSAQRLEETALG